MPKYFDKIKFKHFATLPYLVFIATLSLTIGITYKFYQDSVEKNQAKFNEDKLRIVKAIDDKLNHNLYVFYGLRGILESSPSFDRQRINQYVKQLDLEANFRGIQGIGYYKVFNSEQGQTLTQKLNDEGFTDFNQSPLEEKIVPQATIYFNPSLESKGVTVRYDIANEPIKNELFERIKDTGKATASEKVLLSIQKAEDNQSGFLIYFPIYENRALASTEVDGQNQIIGFISASFNADEFLKGVLENASSNNIGISIFDGSEGAENLLAETVAEKSGFFDNLSRNYVGTEELNFAGRKWVTKFHSLENFTGQSSLGWTPLIFFCGIGFSLLLFGILKQNSNSLFLLERKNEDLIDKELESRAVAERANLAKGEFISVVSHELRTPLNAIAGWTKIIQKDDITSDTRNLALSKIEKNLRSQTKLVEELLEYARIISETESISESDVDISVFIRRIFEEFEPQASEKNINFVNELNFVGNCINGDEKLLKIVFQNLISNALKFTESGGEISLVLKDYFHEVEIRISDTGQGISPEYLPTIFEIFSQADASTTRNHGGFGLGLSITNRIVKLHKGSIEVNSDGIGKGSTFTVKFPYKNKENADL